MTSTTQMAKKGVLPPDHHDQNHPHYPGGLKHQSVGRRSLFSNKGILIAVIITLTFSLPAVIIGAVAFTRTYHNVVAAPEANITVSSSPTASPEVQTVFENATTVVYTITHVPVLFISELAAVTVTVSPTLVAAEAPLRPILTKKGLAVATTTATANVHTTATATIKVSTIASETSQPSNGPGGCLFSGNWPLKSQCEQNCPAWAGHSTHCEVDQHAKWVCASCPIRVW